MPPLPNNTFVGGCAESFVELPELPRARPRGVTQDHSRAARCPSLGRCGAQELPQAGAPRTPLSDLGEGVAHLRDQRRRELAGLRHEADGEGCLGLHEGGSGVDVLCHVLDDLVTFLGQKGLGLLEALGVDLDLEALLELGDGCELIAVGAVVQGVRQRDLVLELRLGQRGLLLGDPRGSSR